MGSTMKPTIFNERVANALKNWRQTAKKHIKQKKISTTTTPMSSRPGTPSHHISPIHLLRHYRGEMESPEISPRSINHMERWNINESPSPLHLNQVELSYIDLGIENRSETSSAMVTALPQGTHRESEITIDVLPKDFSFEKRSST